MAWLYGLLNLLFEFQKLPYITIQSTLLRLISWPNSISMSINLIIDAIFEVKNVPCLFLVDIEFPYRQTFARSLGGTFLFAKPSFYLIHRAVSKQCTRHQQIFCALKESYSHYMCIFGWHRFKIIIRAGVYCRVLIWALLRSCAKRIWPTFLVRSGNAPIRCWISSTGDVKHFVLDKY